MAKSKTKSDAETQKPNIEAEAKSKKEGEQQSSATEIDNKHTSKVPESEHNESSLTDAPEKDEESGGRGITFWVILSIGGSIAVCILLFVVAVVVGMTSGRWENVASMIAIIRDLMIILLVMEGILVGIALIAMIVQLSLLLNVLQNEISPILDNAQETVTTVKGTARFIGKHVTSPIIRAKSAVAGTRAFVRGVSDLRAMASATMDPYDDDDNESDDDD
jgi:hypothetical protein